MTAQDLVNLAMRHYRAGRPAQAEPLLRQALALDPALPAWKNLGDSLYRLGRFGEAIVAYQRALELQPDLLNALLNLANSLSICERYEETVSLMRQTAMKWPDCAEAHAALGTALYVRRNYDKALPALVRAVELDSNLPDALNSLGNLLKDTGEIERAVDCYTRAVAAAPRNAIADSNRVYAMHFDPRFSAADIYRENRLWNARHAETLKRFIGPHDNARQPDRRLRIGYVSPDFRAQAESFFTIPLLANHHHAAFEIHCYSSVPKPDHLTARIRQYADVWRDVARESNEALAGIIRADQIDILVDLTMHMCGNRALLFARKPAPVQVCWLAYPGGTGMDTMDYRVTDSIMDPADADTSCYCEQSIRLPDCWVAYDPLIDIPPRSPQQTGPITFGSLNNPAKLNERLLTLWGRLLQATGGSRLLLQVWSLEHRRRIVGLMEPLGVAPERLDFVGWMERPEYLRLYDRIDIALDPLPYNGITTTCDALWMGTPVLTLAGQIAAGRAGEGMLCIIGLGDWVARSPEEFVEKGVQFAADLPHLMDVRRITRRMTRSPLMNGRRFARHFEAAYREIWRKWCQTR